MLNETDRRHVKLLLHEIAHDLPGASLHITEVEDSLRAIARELEAGSPIRPLDLSDVADLARMALDLLVTCRATIMNMHARMGLPLDSETQYPVYRHAETVVEESIAAFAARARFEKNVEFRLLVADTPLLLVREAELRRAMLNLISNAVRYSFSSSGTSEQRYVSVTVRPWQADGALVSIENYGVGFLPEEEPAIRRYDERGMFARHERPQGSGLGLPEAERILKRHRGDLAISSELATTDINLAGFRELAHRDFARAARVPWRTTVVARFRSL